MGRYVHEYEKIVPSGTTTWLTADPSSGSNRETITLTAEANPNYLTRSAVVTISAAGATSQNITITQDEKTPTAISPAIVFDVTIYPNPVIDIIHVKLKQKDIPSTISLCNLDGKQFMQQKISTIITEIDMTNYHSGLYILTIIASGKDIEKEIVKQ